MVGVSGLACFDINGDNKEDLLWTSYSEKDSMLSVRVHYSNTDGIDITPSIELLNDWAYNVANAGDMNGDSYNDILISSNYSDRGGDSYIFVYSGGPKMDTNFDAGVGLSGYSQLGRYGSMAAIGDVNGDGYGDIIAGAPGYKWFSEHGYWAIFLGSSYIPVTSVKDTAIYIPENFKLFQNFPNPFNPTTTIEYTLEKSGNIILKVYNTLGEEVKTLVKDYQTQGSYKIKLNATGLPSGTYYYTLTVTGEDGETHKLTKQMILIK